MTIIITRILNVIRRIKRKIFGFPEASATAKVRDFEEHQSVGLDIFSSIPSFNDRDFDGMHKRYVERRGFILTDMISELLPSDQRFTIIDGGARDALQDPRWRVFPPARVRLYGFEPDESEVEGLNAQAVEEGLDYRFFAGALWGKVADITFFENKSPGGSSCFPQNTDLTHRWKFQNQQDFFLSKDIFYPTGTSEWSTTTLDDWSSAVGGVDGDFMKLNVQSAELEILNGGKNVLKHLSGLMVEMSFVESYKARPFFSDIDTHLRDQGFRFFDLIGLHYMGRADAPITASHLPGLYPLWGQLIEAHGIYFRDPIEADQKGENLEEFSVWKILKLISFAEVFGQMEYAFEVLLWLSKNKEKLSSSISEEALSSLLVEGLRRYKMIMS